MKSIFLATILLLPALASADTNEIRAQEQACLATAESTLDMNNCEGTAFTAADQELNTTYQKYVAQLKASAVHDKKSALPDALGSTEILRRLVASEKAWIVYRDADCSFQATEMLGGSGEGQVYSACEVTATLARISDLNDTLDSD